MYRSIVAVYSGLSDPSALQREIENSGVPANQIHISTDRGPATTAPAADARESGGFFDWLFGVPENDVTLYRQSLDAGRTIVKVHVTEAQNEKVSQILDRYDPIDVHSDREQVAGATGVQASTSPGVAGSTAATGTTARTENVGTARAGSTGTREAIPVVEEDVKVGKRQVERGGVRVRSYVVEQPFEELVRLRDETVRVERRPVSGTAPVGADAFKERSFEMRERDEEAVVQKTARVKEEVIVSKEVGERTEQIRDKARRTQVDVEKEPEIAGTESGGPARPRR
jgi:stress response protein YsnF